MAEALFMGSALISQASVACNHRARHGKPAAVDWRAWMRPAQRLQSSQNPRSPARSAVIGRPNGCQPTLASSSMNARAAASFSSRSRATAACSAPMDRSSARRSRPAPIAVRGCRALDRNRALAHPHRASPNAHRGDLRSFHIRLEREFARPTHLIALLESEAVGALPQHFGAEQLR